MSDILCARGASLILGLELALNSWLVLGVIPLLVIVVGQVWRNRLSCRRSSVTTKRIAGSPRGSSPLLCENDGC
jgi:hypothetical protein